MLPTARGELYGGHIPFLLSVMFPKPVYHSVQIISMFTINTDPFPAVPDELKDKRQWVLWKHETRKGKSTKVPYQTNGQHAKINKPATWNEYKSVCHEYSKGSEYTGIGFVFCDTDDYTGIDLDDCIDDKKEIKPWAKEIVEKLKAVSYGEVSPSGNGSKFWTCAKLPADVKKQVYVTSDGNVCLQGSNTDGAIEVYDNGRYFTVTGKGKYDIKDGQDVVNWLYEEYLKPQDKKAHKGTKQQTTPSSLSANDVIAKIRQSKQAHKFEALMNGNITGYGSPSEADMALCAVIAFWTQDTTIIDAIFRQSKLMRDKWDEKHFKDGETYGQMTIEKACNKLQQTYQPPKKKTPRRRPPDGFFQQRWKRRRCR